MRETLGFDLISLPESAEKKCRGNHFIWVESRKCWAVLLRKLRNVWGEAHPLRPHGGTAVWGKAPKCPYYDASLPCYTSNGWQILTKCGEPSGCSRPFWTISLTAC